MIGDHFGGAGGGAQGEMSLLQPGFWDNSEKMMASR